MLALEQFVRSKGQMNTFFKNVRESADGIALPSRPFLRSRKGKAASPKPPFRRTADAKERGGLQKQFQSLLQRLRI